MIGDPNNMEVEILLKIRSQMEDLIKVKKEFSGMSKEIKEVGKSSGGAFREMQSGIRNILSPIIMLRRTIFQIGAAWSLTAGTVIIAINDIQKKQQELNDISAKTGISTVDISKQLYGFNVSSDQARAGVLALQEAQQGLNRLWTAGTKGITEFVGKLKIADEKNKIVSDRMKQRQSEALTEASNEKYGLLGGFLKRVGIKQSPGALFSPEERNKIELEAEVEAIKRINIERQKYNANQKEAIILRADYQSKILQFQGKELEAFKYSMDAQRKIYVDMYGSEGGVVALFDDFYKMQEEKMRLSNLGLKQQWEIQREYFRDNVNIMRSHFTAFIQDAFGGKLRTAREYFHAFLQDIINAWIKAQVEMAMTQFVGGSRGSGGSLLGNIFSGALALFSRGASSMQTVQTAQVAPMASAGGSTIVPVRPHAKGGWAGINGPEITLLGENEPELVIPASKMQEREPEGSITNVHYYIQAVDAQSFAELVSRNPDAIVAVTSKAIERNKGLRKTIREFA